jgi:hypothetical protein
VGDGSPPVPHQDGAPQGRASCPQGAETNAAGHPRTVSFSQSVRWTNIGQVPGPEIMRRPGACRGAAYWQRRNRAPYQDAKPLGRARRPRRAESNAAGLPQTVAISRSVRWTNIGHVPGREILRRPGDRAPYLDAELQGRTRRNPHNPLNLFTSAPQRKMKNQPPPPV